MMLAVALFIAAGAPNAWALLVPARRVTRGSNRILSEANLAQLKLVASDAAAGDEFGYSVAIDGDTLVVGAYAKDSDTGSVYVFRTSDGGATYGQVAKLTASDGASGDKFGVSVAIDGATVVVGAYYKNSYRGAAYVFRTTDGGATYDEVAKLTASDGASYDYFGKSVAIDGDTVVVGAVNAGTGGAVYVLRTSDGGATYGEVAKLTASDATADDKFGVSVAIDGATVVVGAYYGSNNWKGSTYVFQTSDGGATYGQVAKLTASDAAAGDYFGWSVAVDGATIVVGAPNGEAAYVFRTTDGGATYDQLAKLTASDAAEGDRFGISVAIDGNTVVVGAQYDDDGGSNSGAVYVFRTTDGGATYGQMAKLTASDAAVGDYFGWSVAISNGTVVAGANARLTGSGSAYVFSPQPTPTPQPTVSPQPTSIALGSDAATRTGPLLALLVAAGLAL